MNKNNEPLPRTILMMTSSFPRYEGDYFGPWILDYCRELVRQGERVVILAPRVSDEDIDQLSSDQLIIKRFNYWWTHKAQRLVHPPGMIPQIKSNPYRFLQIPSLLWGYYRKARSIIKEYDISIIHCQWIIPAGFVGALLKLRYKLPLIVTSQGAELYLSKWHPFSYFTRWTIRQTDHLLPVSQQMAEKALTFGASHKQITVVPNTVNTRKFRPFDCTAFRQQLDIPEDATVILTVRRLVKEKRVQDVIEVFTSLARDHQNIYLVIGGDGPLKESLIQLSIKSGFSEKVKFLGYVNNYSLPEIYSAADIYVLSSEQEGLSLSLLEAIACGCIVISTRGTGAEGIIENGVTGYLYEAGNTAELRSRILEIEKLDRVDKDRLLSNISNIISKDYTNEKMVERWVNVYDQLVSLERN